MHSPFFLFEVICSKFLTALRGYYTSDKEKYNQMVLEGKVVHVYEKKSGFSLIKITYKIIEKGILVKISSRIGHLIKRGNERIIAKIKKN